MCFPGTHGDTKNDVLSACSGDFKHIGSRRISHSAVDNGQFCLWNRKFLIYMSWTYIFLYLWWDITTRVYVLDAGTYKHVGRRGPQHNLKDTDGSLIVGEGKPLKRGGSSSYSSHEVCFGSIGVCWISFYQFLYFACTHNFNFGKIWKCRNRFGFKSQVLDPSVLNGKHNSV